MAGEGKYGVHADSVYFDTDEGRKTLPEVLDDSGSSDLTWETLPGKPATFPPSSHSHSIDDVDGLQGTLDGKQAAGDYASASHSHGIGDVTGLQAALDGKADASALADLVARVEALETPEG